MNGVIIIGHENIPSRIPGDASSLYAKNILNFLAPLADSESGKLSIDWNDELISETLICRDGSIVHPALVK